METRIVLYKGSLNLRPWTSASIVYGRYAAKTATQLYVGARLKARLKGLVCI